MTRYESDVKFYLNCGYMVYLETLEFDYRRITARNRTTEITRTYDENGELVGTYKQYLLVRNSTVY